MGGNNSANDDEPEEIAILVVTRNMVGLRSRVRCSLGDDRDQDEISLAYLCHLY